MNSRCVNCGRFVPKGRKLCGDCMKTIAEMVEKSYKPAKRSTSREEKQTRDEAAYRDELKRLFSLDEDAEDMDIALVESEEGDKDISLVVMDDGNGGVLLGLHIPYKCSKVTIDLGIESEEKEE